MGDLCPIYSINLKTELFLFALPPKLGLSCLPRLFPLPITVCCKPRDRLRQKPCENAENFFVNQCAEWPVAIQVCLTVW